MLSAALVDDMGFDVVNSMLQAQLEFGSDSTKPCETEITYVKTKASRKPRTGQHVYINYVWPRDITGVPLPSKAVPAGLQQSVEAAPGWIKIHLETLLERAGFKGAMTGLAES
eukprot:scaffold291637_cov48-Prasinocladus_malaysianus.AAC.1